MSVWADLDKGMKAQAAQISEFKNILNKAADDNRELKAALIRIIEIGTGPGPVGEQIHEMCVTARKALGPK